MKNESQTDFIFTDDSEANADVVAAANAALGPLEVAIRGFLEGAELERVLAMLHARRQHVIVCLVAGLSVGAERRTLVWRAADGCYEGVAFDSNTGKTSRRRYAAPPPLNEVTDEELVASNMGEQPYRYRRFV